MRLLPLKLTATCQCSHFLPGLSCRQWVQLLESSLGTWLPEARHQSCKNAINIPVTISTTKRVNTCLIPSPVSWRIQVKKMGPCTSFCSKRACAVSCSGVPFGTIVIYFGMRRVVPETPKPSFAGHARLHEHIAWTLRPFLALDSRLFRGKMSPKKSKKTNNVETLRRKNGTDLVSKPINWIWSCALRSILLPHSSDDCSSKSLCGALGTSILAMICDYQSKLI